MDNVTTSLITSQQVQNFLHCSAERACVLTALFHKVFPLYHIDTLPRIRMTIAQCSHESYGFLKKVENLNYSTTALMNTWPKRFPTLAKAKLYAHNPEKLANYVYGGRMGNDKPGDGWHFRGSSYIQLTGKENIGGYTKYKGLSNVYDVAVLLRENDEYAIDASCWYLTKRVDTLPAMDKEDIVGVTRLVNGGVLGLTQRKELYQKAKLYFS